MAVQLPVRPTFEWLVALHPDRRESGWKFVIAVNFFRLVFKRQRFIVLNHKRRPAWNNHRFSVFDGQFDFHSLFAQFRMTPVASSTREGVNQSPELSFQPTNFLIDRNEIYPPHPSFSKKFGGYLQLGSVPKTVRSGHKTAPHISLN